MTIRFACAALANLMRRVPRIVPIAAVCLVAGCGGEDDGVVVVVNPGGQPPVAPPTPTPTSTPPPAGRVTVDFTFRREAAPWQAVFADYPAERAPLLRNEARLVRLPPELGTDNGLLLSGAGIRGGLFSGVWRRVDGLRPFTSYRVNFTLTLASNLGRGCTGAFTRAGETQVVKAGASGVVPEPTSSGIVRLPLDKGTPSGSGRNMVAVGDLAVPALRTCVSTNRFYRKQFSSETRGPAVATDSLGRLWLVVGVDSRHDGGFGYYLIDGSFALTPA